MKPNQKDELLIVSSLKDAGVRVTKQRVALLYVLDDAKDHPDAIELHKRASEVEPTISLATVYRTLLVLIEAKIVHRHSFEGGGARFEKAKKLHHDHIVDLSTGEVIEFNSEVIEKLQFEIAAEMGYELIHHKLELYCRKIN
jgi:Fur family ferric uptake transcriptional regulator